MRGVKHLIQCHCVLPQFRKSIEPVFHKFIVFSVIDDEDNVSEKLAQCNNCGIIHKVVDICKSEIMSNFEDSIAITKIEDLKYGLSKNIISILETHDCDLATWEHVSFIVENSLWNETVSISRESVRGSRFLKILKIMDESRVKIETQILEEVIGK